MCRIEVLQIIDPAYSWYNQDPSCQWKGGEFFSSEIKKAVRLGGYSNVVFIGDSMGGAAALRFSGLADYVLAFTPQIDVEKYEAVKRLDFTAERRREFKRRIVGEVERAEGFIEVHYGGECAEDARQVGLLGGGAIGTNRRIVIEKFDQHTLSIDLKKKGLLKGIVRAFLLRSLGQAPDLLTVGAKVAVFYDYYHVGRVEEVDGAQGKVLVRYKKAGDEYWETYPPAGGEIRGEGGGGRAEGGREGEGKRKQTSLTLTPTPTVCYFPPPSSPFQATPRGKT